MIEAIRIVVALALALPSHSSRVIVARLFYITTDDAKWKQPNRAYVNSNYHGSNLTTFMITTYEKNKFVQLIMTKS
jgi:hypothetical protein